LRGRPNDAYDLRFVRVEPFVVPKKSLTGENTERALVHRSVVCLHREVGQVDELVIAATPDAIAGVKDPGGDRAAERNAQERAADELIVSARNTGAKVRVIEDRDVVAPIGGVGAFLRFKL